MRELRDRVAVVTGAGSGIGEGLSLRLAEEGMRVVVADIETDQADRVAREIRAAGGQAISAYVNVADRSSVEALADRAYAEFGAVHLLCNNAGVLLTREIADMSEEDWHWIINVDLYGPINGVMAFVPRMLRQGHEGHILNTSSMAGMVPLEGSGLGAYTVAKYGVVALSEMLRAELASHRIGVSVFCPIGVATNIGNSERNRNALTVQVKSVGAEMARPASLSQRRKVTLPLRNKRPSERYVQSPVMTPRQVAHVIVAGIRANRAYIFSHPEISTAVEARCRTILNECREQWPIVEEARKL